MQKYTLYIIIGIIAFCSSCKRDSYDTGEGNLSYLHADYTDITIHDGAITNAVTDDDITLIMPADVRYADATVKDTLIRSLLYYNMPNASEAITLYKTTSVAVLVPHDPGDVMTSLTDPVKLTSMWISKNRRYLNMQLGIMVGSNTDSAASQLLTFSRDSTRANATFLTLHHDQAGYEQYYTQDIYLSIPMDSLRADTINVTVNTYSSRQTRRFIK